MSLPETIAAAQRIAVASSGRPVTYHRGTSSVEVTAMVGHTDAASLDEYGVAETTRLRDYMILVEDLILDGERVEPWQGDRIREREGGTVHVYGGMGPGGEPPWRYSGSGHSMYRVHTKHIDTETG